MTLNRPIANDVARRATRAQPTVRAKAGRSNASHSV